MTAFHPVTSGMDVNDVRLQNLSTMAAQRTEKKYISGFRQEITDCNCIIESAARSYQGKKSFSSFHQDVS